MRTLAAKLTRNYLRRNPVRNAPPRSLSTYNGRDELNLDQDAEKKIGWLLNLIFAGTATCVAYNIMLYMGDNLLQQSVSLLQVKDPLFKRIGASRLAQFAIDDERRMKIVEMGGAQELVNMLGGAKDDRTRKEALKALSALSSSGLKHLLQEHVIEVSQKLHCQTFGPDVQWRSQHSAVVSSRSLRRQVIYGLGADLWWLRSPCPPERTLNTIEEGGSGSLQIWATVETQRRRPKIALNGTVSY